MKSQGLTIKELAAKSKLTHSYLIKLLNDDRRWNLPILNQVLEALNMEFEIKPAPKGRKKVMT
jgi:transcriptional regulator with XRE-family HTH domain